MIKIILFIFLAGSVLLNAQKFVEFTLNLKYDGEATFVKAGYSDVTTDDYDESYEEDYPPFPPPNGIILPAFRIKRNYPDGSSELIYSPKDYRKTPERDTTIDYTLDILGTREEGRTFYIEAPVNSISGNIKSIRIIDAPLEGKLVDSNIVNGKRLYIDNRFIQNFIVRVTYDVTTDIEDNIDNSNQIYFAGNTIYLDELKANKIELYNIEGQRILSDEITKNVYNLENINNGIYLAYIYDNDVVIRMLKIVKL